LHAGFPVDQAEREVALLKRAAERDPLSPALHMALGLMLEKIGEVNQAIDAYETAIALAPNASSVSALLGRLLVGTNRLREAEVALRRALALDAESPPIRCDHAVVLLKLHRHADARAEFLSVLEDCAPHEAVLCNLANATACLGLQEEAAILAKQAIATDPQSALARRTLCNVLPYHPACTAEAMADALRACDRTLSRPSAESFSNSPDPDRPLTVGLLSGTLRAHPVGWLTVAGFEALDPLAFRLICLSQGPSGSDPVARRFQAIGQWTDISRLDDQVLARRTRELGIDLLIDLGGYGEGARMIACARRLAPVQIKWVGSQNHSSGLREMDWFITDRWETPPGLEVLYSERLLRLADGYVCYSPPAYAPDVEPLPALRRGWVTFGCFNNLAKLTPRVIAAWSDILRRTSGARLVLRTHQLGDGPTADRIRTLFAINGVSADRIEHHGSSGHRELMGKYNDIDIILDPFPYAGGLTTCEALWMGVPTVTLAGETFASRHSLSHMRNVGLDGWQAANIEEYCSLSAAKAADLSALAALRSQLRGRMRASPLCNADRFGIGLAANLRYAWREWCSATQP
jgi:predicted O-linked N-acetylglucosamine transferase (SPINDLY family)